MLEEKATELAVKAGLVFVEPDGGQLKEISTLLEDQLIKPLPVKVFPLEEAGSALLESEQGHVRGKLVLKVC